MKTPPLQSELAVHLPAAHGIDGGRRRDRPGTVHRRAGVAVFRPAQSDRARYEFLHHRINPYLLAERSQPHG